MLFECYDDYISPLEDTGYVLTHVYGEGTNEYGIRDLQGNLIVPLGEYDLIYGYSSDACRGLLEVKKDGMWGIIDTAGNLIYPVEYEKATVFKNDSAALWKDGLVSLYDSQGNLLYQDRNCHYITLTGECYEVWQEDGITYLTPDGKQVDAQGRCFGSML